MDGGSFGKCRNLRRHASAQSAKITATLGAVNAPPPPGADDAGSYPAHGTAPAAARRSRPVGALALAALAAVAHVVVGVFYLSSGLMAPMWAIVLLLVWWALLAAWLVRAAWRGSWWTPLAPLVAVVTWFAVMTAGEKLLGWTG
jgi:hypothetical protein